MVESSTDLTELLYPQIWLRDISRPMRCLAGQLISLMTKNHKKYQKKFNESSKDVIFHKDRIILLFRWENFKLPEPTKNPCNPKNATKQDV